MSSLTIYYIRQLYRRLNYILLGRVEQAIVLATLYTLLTKVYYRLIIALVVEVIVDLIVGEQQFSVVKLRFKEYLIVNNFVSLLKGRKDKDKGQKGARTFLSKFAQLSNKRQQEGELLKLAKKKGVISITIQFNYKQITIDNDLDSILYLR